MEKDECWETFLMSGKVTDYLSYRQATQDAELRTESRVDALGEKEPDDRVKKHAGFY